MVYYYRYIQQNIADLDSAMFQKEKGD